MSAETEYSQEIAYKLGEETANRKYLEDKINYLIKIIDRKDVTKFFIETYLKEILK